MRTLAWLSLAGLLASGQAHAAGRMAVLDPSTNWTLEYGDERCSLIRNFGTGEDTLRLQLDSYGDPASFRLLLAGGPVPRSRAPFGEVRYGFPADHAERERVSAIQGTSGRLPAVSFGLAFAPYAPEPDAQRMSLEEHVARNAEPRSPSLEFEAQVSSMTVEFDNRTRVQLNLPDMVKPLAAMRQCIDSLTGSWGLDPALQRTLVREPVPDPSSVERVVRTYPQSMVFQGQSAFVPVRIMVDPAGQAGECVVQVPAVETAFKEAVCKGLARRFSPALDSDGKPVASVYRTSVIYRIGS